VSSHELREVWVALYSDVINQKSGNSLQLLQDRMVVEKIQTSAFVGCVYLVGRMRCALNHPYSWLELIWNHKQSHFNGSETLRLCVSSLRRSLFHDRKLTLPKWFLDKTSLYQT
jgi:hypothetical protein